MLAASTDSSQTFYYCKWHRLWAMDLPSTLKWGAYSGLLVLDQALGGLEFLFFPVHKPPVRVLNCLQSWSLWDKNWILFTDEVLWDFCCLLPLLPPDMPLGREQQCVFSKVEKLLEAEFWGFRYLGVHRPWADLLVKRTKSAEHSFMSGNWILWTYGRLMGCHFSFSHSLFTLPW